MPSTLVTGGNSFVAGHVIDNLIKRGHEVTGVVRRDSAGEAVLALHPEWKDSLDFVTISALESQSAWEDLFKSRSFDHIIHTAAPMLDGKDYETEFLQPAIKMNTSLLHAAKAHLHSLKSIAVTGSVNGSTTGQDDALRAIYASENPDDQVISPRTWLPFSREEARSINVPFISYCSAKKEGDLAIWDFVEKEKPSFGVTVFLPALIFGPPIQPISKPPQEGGLNFSIGLIYALFDGSTDTAAATVFPSWIDARDLAEAHIRALTEPKVWGKRLTIGGEPLHFRNIVRIMKGLKELEGRKVVAENKDDEGRVMAKIDASEGNEKLGMKFRSLEETIGDTVRKIIELEKKD